MQATVPTTNILPRPAPKPEGSPPEHHLDPLHGMDDAVESAVGVDLRLLYGMLVPVLVVVGLIFALVIVRSYWLVAAAWIPEILLLGLIVIKLLAMLNEPEQPEPPADAG